MRKYDILWYIGPRTVFFSIIVILCQRTRIFQNGADWLNFWGQSRARYLSCNTTVHFWKKSKFFLWLMSHEMLLKARASTIRRKCRTLYKLRFDHWNQFTDHCAGLKQHLIRYNTLIFSWHCPFWLNSKPL